jgi:membrane protein YqaA with SNARE-associated domain
VAAIIGMVTSALHDFTMATLADEHARRSSTIAAASTVIGSTARHALAIAQDAAIARAWSTSSTYGHAGQAFLRGRGTRCR